MKTTLIASAVALTVALPAAATTFTETFTGYYAFGDSLTDDGKFGTLFPPSLEGRFSDGPTYAEFVAGEFATAGLDTGNLALGGATGSDVNANALGPLGTFAGQIGTFVNALTTGTSLPTRFDFTEFTADTPTPGNNPLASVFFGGNDFFQAFDAADDLGLGPAESFGFIANALNEAADSVTDNIRLLSDLTGGLFNDFLLLDLPDVGGTPAFAPAASLATPLTDVFNARLAANIGALNDDGINVSLFGTDDTLAGLLAQIEGGDTSFGITNTTGSCTLSLSEPGPSCDDPTIFAFADSVHPSGTVQQFLGEAVIAELNASVAPVPLPATLPLVIFGLGAMGWAGRRRAA